MTVRYVLWKRHGFPSAGEFHWTSCPHCEDPLDDAIHACTHHLLFCREILRGVYNEWANLVHKVSVQGVSLITTQLGGMEGSCVKAFSEHSCLQEPLLNPCYKHIGLMFVHFKALNRNQVCRFWIL
jgi:hypothetical protein